MVIYAILHQTAAINYEFDVSTVCTLFNSDQNTFTLRMLHCVIRNFTWELKVYLKGLQKRSFKCYFTIWYKFYLVKYHVRRSKQCQIFYYLGIL